MHTSLFNFVLKNANGGEMFVQLPFPPAAKPTTCKYKITSTLLKNTLHLCPEYFAIKHTTSGCIMNTDCHESSSSMWHSCCCHEAQNLSMSVLIVRMNTTHKTLYVHFSSTACFSHLFRPSLGRTITIYMEMHTEVEAAS